jgi:hypothetical protein
MHERHAYEVSVIHIHSQNALAVKHKGGLRCRWDENIELNFK